MATRYKGEFRLSPVVLPGVSLKLRPLIIVSGRLEPAVKPHLTAPIKQCFHAIYLDTQPLLAITFHERQAKSRNALLASRLPRAGNQFPPRQPLCLL